MKNDLVKVLRRVGDDVLSTEMSYDEVCRELHIIPGVQFVEIDPTGRIGYTIGKDHEVLYLKKEVDHCCYVWRGAKAKVTKVVSDTDAINAAEYAAKKSDVMNAIREKWNSGESRYIVDMYDAAASSGDTRLASIYGSLLPIAVERWEADQAWAREYPWLADDTLPR